MVTLLISGVLNAVLKWLNLVIEAGLGVRSVINKMKTKKEGKIKKLDLDFDYELDCYKIDYLRHSDSRIDRIAEKLNEIIDKLND